jgi:tRNA/tmRNA/rRNA uracil-C5-methylase (TrmA/RlmC/RlmD family)
VVGVEGFAPSIIDAAANAEANGVANASYQVGDAALLYSAVQGPLWEKIKTRATQ